MYVGGRMAPDHHRPRGLLRSLWRSDKQRSARIRAEHRAERQQWKSALRRDEEPKTPQQPVGHRSLSLQPLTLRAFTRWALRACCAVSSEGGAFAQDEQLAEAMAALPSGRLRAAALRHLRALDVFSSDLWAPWNVRHVARLTPQQRRRRNRYQAAIPDHRDDWIDMLAAYIKEPGLRELFNERLARAHHPPSREPHRHQTVHRLFEKEDESLGLLPPLLPAQEKLESGDLHEDSRPELDFFDKVWDAKDRRRKMCQSPACCKHDDPRRHPEWWAVLAGFFELWRIGVRDARELRVATASLDAMRAP